MLSTQFEPNQIPPTRGRFDGTAPDLDPDAGIAPLLSRANLLRVRGQWDEAVAVCADALRRAPESAAAYALLGDIYAAQNKNSDAVQWYRMAHARNPQSAALADKLRQLSAMPAPNTLPRPDATAVLPAMSSPIAPTPRLQSTADRTLEWFDHLLPAGRSGKAARLLYTASGVVMVLVLLAGAGLYLSHLNGDSEKDTRLSESRPLSPPRRRAPRTIATETAGQKLPTLSVGVPTPREPVPMNLMTAFTAGGVGDFQVTTAQTDAQGTQAQLEIVLRPHPGESITMIRSRVLQASSQACNTALTALPDLSRFSVRVLIRTGNSDQPGADLTNANVVFVGETSNTALRALQTTSPVPDARLLSAVFTNTWWSTAVSRAQNQ